MGTAFLGLDLAGIISRMEFKIFLLWSFKKIFQVVKLRNLLGGGQYLRNPLAVPFR